MHFVDTHIHLQNFDIPAEEVISLLRQNGVDKCICISATEDDWKKVGNLAQKFPQTVIPAFAVHPWYATTPQSGWQERLEQKLKDFPQALIGECGLDLLKGAEISLQQKVFEEHIALAKQYNRPLLLHMVKAWSLLNDYLKMLPQQFVFHSFNGSSEMLRQIIKHNGYIAINAKILQTKHAEEVIKSVPKNRLLLETDAPYQTKISDLPILCEKIALIRGERVEETAENVYNNSLRIINL